MSKWKEVFSKSVSLAEELADYEYEYKFGPPANSIDIESLNSHLRMPIPKELEELLKEFNGVLAKDKYWGWKELYLSINSMMIDLPEYFNESGNPLPPTIELCNTVFFAQQNGYGVLFGICTSGFNGFEVGQILAMESDAGELYLECNSLYDFVSSSEYCSLG